MVIGCSADTRQAEVSGAATGKGTIPILWKHPGRDATTEAAAGAKLVYNGGPVIPNVKAYIVEWGPNVWPDGLATMKKFFQTIPNSPYVDWLSEYNTPTQKIGRGTFGGVIVDSNPPAGTTIDDTQIQAELTKLFDAGTLPKPTANTYYQVLFPPGVTVTAEGTSFCVAGPFGIPCAYHQSFSYNGTNVYYSPQPDYSGQCGTDCGFVPGNSLASLTTAASHEMVEAITDPAPWSGWNDPTNGEIGDICEVESQGQQVNGIYVQTEWSNVQNACIVSAGGCTPTCTGKSCGDDGCGGSCGTCPTGETCNTSGQCVATCVPKCSGKACGDDGCGGSCGTCASGSTCNASGQCVSTTTGCSHAICSTGGKLTKSCDPCATKICASDSYCCSTSWDSQCVAEVKSICGESCGGGTSSCAHPICSAGAKLAKSCDPCATKICAADSYCCATSWDSVCVGEVKSICGETC
jgi:hypothetical protein